jgi:GDPmannose 4,6-dehydratase
MSSGTRKRSIVVGHAGQDGRLLISDLQNRGDEIIGIGRSSCLRPPSFSGRITDDISNAGEINALVQTFLPDEVYYLAAYHTSSEALGNQATVQQQFENAQAIHVTGLVNFLSAIMIRSPSARLFYASSSLIFNGQDGESQNEFTPLTPQGFYGITKAQGMWLCREFREKYGVFASVGILYNHESHLRSTNFLSAKIIQTAIRIAAGAAEKLVIGNLSSRVDWGYAKDYVLAFQKILAADMPNDFIVATGEAHTVKEFIDIVFNYFDLTPEMHVFENEEILTRTPRIKIGNAKKLRDTTEWRPSLGYEDFVVQLIKDHLACRAQ